MYDVYIMPTPHLPTMAVVRALRRLGGDLRTARLKRRLPMRVVAERAGISRATLQRVERGDAGVGAGVYASVARLTRGRVGEVAPGRWPHAPGWRRPVGDARG
jgi:hypothetical protein